MVTNGLVYSCSHCLKIVKSVIPACAVLTHQAHGALCIVSLELFKEFSILTVLVVSGVSLSILGRYRIKILYLVGKIPCCNKN